MLSRGRRIEYDHLALAADIDAHDLHRRGGLKAPEHRGDIAQGAVRNLLPDNPSVRRCADRDLTAFTVEKRAKRLTRTTQLGRRALELECLGLAAGDELFERCAIHGESTVMIELTA